MKNEEKDLIHTEGQSFVGGGTFPYSCLTKRREISPCLPVYKIFPYLPSDW